MLALKDFAFVRVQKPFLSMLFYQTARIISASLFCLSVPLFAEMRAKPVDLNQYKPSSLDKEFSQKVEALLKIPSIGNAILSRSGKRIYFNSNRSGIDQIWQFDLAEQKVNQLTVGASKSSLLAVSDNDQELIFSRDTHGDELKGLFKMDLKNRSVTRIFAKKGFKSVFGGLSADGFSVFYFSNFENKQFYNLYEYNLKTKKTQRRLVANAKYRFVGQVAPDKIILIEDKGPRLDALYELDITTSKLEPLMTQDKVKSLGSLDARLGSDQAIYLRSHHDSDFFQLFRWSDNEAKLVVDKPSFEIVNFQLDIARGLILYTYNQDGFLKSAAYDLNLKANLVPPFSAADLSVSDRIALGKSLSSESKYLLVIEGTKIISRFAIWDPKGQSLRLIDPFQGQPFAEPIFEQARLENCKTKDSRSIPLLVRKPSYCEEHSCHIIVHYHGGPESQAQVRRDPLAELFVRNNFIHVQPNIRGSSGYGRSYMASDDREKRLEVIDDLAAVADCVKAKWVTAGTNQKVGVSGRSYGGYLSQLAMTKYSGHYDAGVAVVGMSNLANFLENIAVDRRSLREREYGSLQSQRQVLEALSPMSYINKARGPMLLIYGVNDLRVPYRESVNMHEALIKNKVASKLILFADEGHKSQKISNRVLEYGHTVDFFLKAFNENLSGANLLTTTSISRDL